MTTLEESIARWVAERPARQGLLDDARRRSTIVDELIAARRDAGLSQKAVAKVMEVKQPTISQFENEGSNPHLSTLQFYARAVGGRLEIAFIPDPVVSGDTPNKTGDEDE